MKKDLTHVLPDSHTNSPDNPPSSVTPLRCTPLRCSILVVSTKGEESAQITLAMGAENDTSSSTREAMAEVMSQIIKVKDWKKEKAVIQSLLDSKIVEIENASKELSNTRILLNTTKTENEELKKELSNTQTSLATTTTENEALRESVRVTEELSNQRKKDTEDLRAKIDEVDSSKSMLEIKRAKSRMREKLNSLVNTFQSRLAFFVGFMAVLLKLPCELVDGLIGLGCVGVFGFALLDTHRSWNIYREFYSESKILKQSISKTTNTATQPILDTNTLPSGHHSTPPSSAFSSNSDLEWGPTSLESKVNKYREWFYHAWPTLLSMVIKMIFYFTIHYFVARYIYTKGCDVPGPTPSPSTSKMCVLVKDMAIAEVMAAGTDMWKSKVFCTT